MGARHGLKRSRRGHLRWPFRHAQLAQGVRLRAALA